MHMSSSIHRGLSMILFFIVVISCNPDEEIELEEDSSVTSTFGIRDDTPLTDYEEVAKNVSPFNTSEYPDFSSVVSLTYSLDGSDNHEFIASGVLVDNNWVLTAGHNFFTSDEQTSPAAITGIDVHIGNDPENPDATFEVEELVFHPTWLDDDGLFLTANDFC